MEERPDKLDAMRLSASLTGFKFEVQPGINGSNIPAKALPGVSKSIFTLAGTDTDKMQGLWRRARGRSWLLSLAHGLCSEVGAPCIIRDGVAALTGR